MKCQMLCTTKDHYMHVRTKMHTHVPDIYHCERAYASSNAFCAAQRDDLLYYT